MGQNLKASGWTALIMGGITVSNSASLTHLAGRFTLEHLAPGLYYVTVFPDDNKKYLSTDLLREEQVKDGYLSPDVQLKDYRAHKRVCHTCCDLYDCTQHLV